MNSTCHYCGKGGLPGTDIACANCEHDTAMELLHHGAKYHKARDRADLVRYICSLSKSEQAGLLEEIDAELLDMEKKVKPALVKSCKLLVKSGYITRQQFHEMSKGNVLSMADIERITA